MALPAPVGILLTSWIIHLRARNLSPRTIENYQLTVERFTKWCDANDIAVDPRKQTAIAVEAWIAHQFATGAADASVVLRYRSLQQWYRWLFEEGEIDLSPMARMRPPKEGEKPVPILTDAELNRLLAVCSGNRWLDRRDTAIIRFLIDTGVRLEELVTISIAELDLGTTSALIHGKGNRQRVVPFGTKTAQALDRYLRARARRPHAESPKLWLGVRGPINDSAIGPMLHARGLQAGVAGVHAHRFRHTAAHRWLVMGGQERDLMSIAGWRSSQMLARYGSSAASERAREAHKRLSPGDRLG